MNYWLIKSEPEEYSFSDLEKESRTIWTGVRNYTARNNLRAMKKGDQVLFYHSVLEKAVVGICEVVAEHYPDPTADQGDWSAVDVAPVRRLAKPVHLSEIKKVPELQNIGLIRIGRLSVMPLSQAEFERIVQMGS